MTRPTRERVDGILERDGGNNGAVSDLCAEVAALRAALAQAEEELSAERDWKVDAIKFREHQDIVKEELRAQVERLREELAATKARWAGELDEKYCAEKWGGDPQYAVFRKRMLDAQAEVERLQRAAVPGNGPEMLRMQVALKRSEAEVERLRAEIEEQRAIAAECDHIREQAVADFMAHPMDETDYEGQLRELRDAVKGLPNRWRDRRRALYLDEGDGAWDECADDLEEALAKAGGQ